MSRIILILIATLSATIARAQTIEAVSSPCSVFGSTSGTCLQGGGPLGSPSSVGTLPAFTYGGVTLSNAVTGTGGIALITGPTFQSSVSVHATTNQNFFIQGAIGGIVTTGVTFESLNDAQNTFLPVNISASLAYFPQGGISVGVSTDPGAGGLQLNGQEFIPNATTDAGLADATACLRSSNGQILKGSGTLGICLGTSGIQFKTALVPMIAGLDEVARLDLLNYRYKNGFGDSGARVQYGLTAQQVATVMPDLVRYDDKGVAINFDIGALLPVALHAIQQLKSDNDNLRNCQQNWKCRLFGIGG